MGCTIAIANQKGGVAKTTSTHNLGVALANSGKKTLIVDFDPQASLTIACKLEPYKMERSIVDALQEPNPAPIEACIFKLRENLYIIPSQQDLSALEVTMIGRTARETILDRALTNIRDAFDYILIDCPPQLSVLTINALSCADYVLAPCKTDYLSFRGLQLLMGSVEQVQKLTNHRLKFMGVLATIHDSRANDAKETLELLNEQYRVIGTIKALTAIRRGSVSGESVIDAKQKRDREGSEAYLEAAEEIRKIVEG